VRIVGEDTIVSAAQIRALYASIGFFARDAKRAGYVGSAGTFTAVLGLKPYAGQAVILLTNGGDDAGLIATGIQARVVAHLEAAAHAEAAHAEAARAEEKVEQNEGTPAIRALPLA
jgi:hypothetical protein